MPNPYNNTGVVDRRDAITRALMNIGAPPPRVPQAQMPQAKPPMGLPQSTPGSPVPNQGPMTMPLAPGAPPMPPGMAMPTTGGTMPATGAPPSPQMPLAGPQTTSPYPRV